LDIPQQKQIDQCNICRRSHEKVLIGERKNRGVAGLQRLLLQFDGSRSHGGPPGCDSTILNGAMALREKRRAVFLWLLRFENEIYDCSARRGRRRKRRPEASDTAPIAANGPTKT
jgi:hypothetical protein